MTRNHLPVIPLGKGLLNPALDAVDRGQTGKRRGISPHESSTRQAGVRQPPDDPSAVVQSAYGRRQSHFRARMNGLTRSPPLTFRGYFIRADEVDPRLKGAPPR